MSPESPENGMNKKIYLTSLVRCFRLRGYSRDDLENFCEWKRIKPPKGNANWNDEWARCKNAKKVFDNGGSEEDAIIAASDKDKKPFRGFRAEGILSAAKVLCRRLNISEQADYKILLSDIDKWKSEGSSSNNQINLSKPYLPTKEDVEYADTQLRNSPDEVVRTSAILEQVEINFSKTGKSLKENWREITEQNIKTWFNKK